MDLLVIIFSGAALIGVCISLIGFLQHVPKQERLSVIALVSVAALLLGFLAVYATTATTNEANHAELCRAANANRSAITQLIILAEREHPMDPALVKAAEVIDGPVC